MRDTQTIKLTDVFLNSSSKLKAGWKDSKQFFLFARNATALGKMGNLPHHILLQIHNDDKKFVTHTA